MKPLRRPDYEEAARIRRTCRAFNLTISQTDRVIATNPAAIRKGLIQATTCKPIPSYTSQRWRPDLAVGFKTFVEESEWSQVTSPAVLLKPCVGISPLFEKRESLNRNHKVFADRINFLLIGIPLCGSPILNNSRRCRRIAARSTLI